MGMSDAAVYEVLPRVNDPLGKCFSKDFRPDRWRFLRQAGDVARISPPS
jgi:hypothetical protein